MTQNKEKQLLIHSLGRQKDAHSLRNHSALFIQKLQHRRRDIKY